MLARLVRDCIAMAFTASAPALLACTSMNRYGPNKSRYAIAYIKYIYILYMYTLYSVLGITPIFVSPHCAYSIHLVQFTPVIQYRYRSDIDMRVT